MCLWWRSSWPQKYRQENTRRPAQRHCSPIHHSMRPRNMRSPDLVNCSIRQEGYKEQTPTFGYLLLSGIATWFIISNIFKQDWFAPICLTYVPFKGQAHYPNPRMPGEDALQVCKMLMFWLKSWDRELSNGVWHLYIAQHRHVIHMSAL